MDKKLTIAVTAEDIETAARFMHKGANGHTSCPIALAAKRALRQRGAKGKLYVAVVSCELNGIEYKLPREAAEFICEFDNGQPVEPFTFEIWEKSTQD